MLDADHDARARAAARAGAIFSDLRAADEPFEGPLRRLVEDLHLALQPREG